MTNHFRRTRATRHRAARFLVTATMAAGLSLSVVAQDQKPLP